MINKIIRNFIAKQVAGRTDDGIMITLKDPKMVVKAPTKEMKEAKEQFKKLIDTYKNKPLDDEAVKKGFKIFTKKPYESIKKK